jgi:xylulokinase
MVSRQPCLIGIDIGTSSTKVGAFDRTGTLLALERSPTPTFDLGRGWAEHDPEALWSVTSSLIRRVVDGVRGAAEPVAVAAASVGEAGLPVDKFGTALRPAIAWFDQRTAGQAEWWKREVGMDQVHRITGQTIDTQFGVNKLLWLREHEPATFSRTAHWLSLADFILLRLSGEVVTDRTLASRTMVYDQLSDDWSSELLAEVRLPKSLFPPVVQSGVRIGSVVQDAAGPTGLLTGTAVVTGGHDRLCGAFAARAGTSAMVDSTGSAEAVVVPTARFEPRGAEETGFVACYADVVPDGFVYSARIAYAGALLDWFRNSVVARSERDNPAPSIQELIDEIPSPLRFSGLFLFPSFGRVVSPFWDPTNAPGFVVGLTLRHTRGHIVQAILEGISYSLRANLQWLERLGIHRTTPLRVEGRASRNPIWMQLKCDITERAVQAVHHEESTALGAAALAGVGIGVFRNHAEAGSAIEGPLSVWTPDSDRSKLYRQVFEHAYATTAPALATVSQLLSALFIESENQTAG